MRILRWSLCSALSVLAIALCLALACGSGDLRRDDLNVVWVVMDAASARHFGPWGVEDDTSPHLDDVAREGVIFERAYAQWPATLASASSYLTGLYPDPKLPPSKLLDRGLATWLRDAGWQTVGFSENPFIHAEHGFERELGELHFVEPLREERGWLDHARRDSKETVTRSLRWIDAHSARPFFLYLHLLPPHAPYASPPPFAGRFSSSTYTGEFDGSTQLLLLQLYWENIAYVDQQLGRLYAGLRARDLLKRTIFVVSSDHGEAFGEHGNVLHGTTLYEEELHVPLVIRFPERFSPLPARWEGVVELVDLVPTLLDALGQPARELAGASLLPALRAQQAPKKLARAWISHRAGLFAAAIGERYKLVASLGSGARELYDLQRDPAETHNLSESEAPLALRLEAALRHGSRPLRSEHVSLDPALRRQLQALGYLDE
jgi:arylsulfatase